MKTGFAIETVNLTKKYGDLTAVDNLNLAVNYGEVFGLLGPNGAGKTTTISMLCTITRPSSGNATVNGFDVAKRPADVRRSIGIVFQDPSVDVSLTGRENLKLHACLYDVPDCENTKKIGELLELVGLTDRADSRMKTYSGGMKRRLELARGLLHNPTILFLDEPTLGLDPQTREHIWTYIRDLAANLKITIIMTTHYMEEAEKLCSRVAIIDAGKIKVNGSPGELKSTLKGDVVSIVTVKAKELADKLIGLGITPDKDSAANTVRLNVKDGEKLVPRLIEIAGEAGIEVNSISVHRPTLNDVFLYYTGRDIRADEAESMGKVFMRSWRGRR
jgi:ABC-2 type transport system ATP-binding protein